MDCKEILLGDGVVAIVDPEDYETLNRHKWYLHHTGYAVRNIRLPDGKQRMQLMHRTILGLEFGDPRQGDHANVDKLDNRRSNLRICDTKQNRLNRRAHKNNSSGYKGVTWHVRRSHWRANIGYKGRQIHLGIFETAE